MDWIAAALSCISAVAAGVAALYAKQQVEVARLSRAAADLANSLSESALETARAAYSLERARAALESRPQLQLGVDDREPNVLLTFCGPLEYSRISIALIRTECRRVLAFTAEDGLPLVNHSSAQLEWVEEIRLTGRYCPGTVVTLPLFLDLGVSDEHGDAAPRAVIRVQCEDEYGFAWPAEVLRAEWADDFLERWRWESIKRGRSSP